MSRTSIIVAFLTLCIAQQALTASIFNTDNVQIHQNPHNDGTIKVWRSLAKFSGSDPRQLVNVADFQEGSLTDRSMMALSSLHTFPSEDNEIVEYQVTVESSDQNDVYNFIEGFDMSGNGMGGLISLDANNGLGTNSFTLSVRAVGPNVPVNLAFAAYRENANDGGSFRIGRYLPGFEYLHGAFIVVPGKVDKVVMGSFKFSQANSTIGLIQGWDEVENGTGGLAAMAGGVGRSNLTMYVNSGIGEDLRSYVTLYGDVA